VRPRDDLARVLRDFDPVSLEDLDARASLQRRVDHKYVVPWPRFVELARELRGDHQALEIEDERAFAYESVYFDTESLSCFRAHVDDLRPRVKVRTRLYRDSCRCSLEVKVKGEEGEMAKEQLDYDPDGHGRLTGAGGAFIARVLDEAGIDLAPGDLAPALVTSFQRGTVGATDGGERMTVDVGLRLARPDGEAVCLREGYAVVETKTEDGEGGGDRLLREAGLEPVSLSKYRLGIGLLRAARDPDPPLGAEAERYVGACADRRGGDG
jgi:hypothetical protein